jgi:HD-GYP domain-containing protein (c-di-GMP phosphodiesterase class II)
MKYVKINELEEGMILSNTLYDDNTNILLRSNKSLSKRMIERIKQLNYDGLYVFEENDIAMSPSIISEETRLKALKHLKHLNIDECLFIANNIVNEIRENNDTIIIETINLSSFDNYTYEHSINVCIMSVVLGIGLGLNDEELNKLSQAALLHDIGKTAIPIDILNKPGKLNDEEYEEMKNHSKYGYNLLKENEDIASTVRNAIFSHHENEDGTGYPRQLTGDKIHKFAKIIHVADVYDALTAKRAYKEPINPADALEFLISQTGKMFDERIVKLFIEYIALYPVGTKVLLSTNEEARVVANNEKFLSRPIVKTDSGKKINLLETLDITIIDLLTK